MLEVVVSVESFLALSKAFETESPTIHPSTLSSRLFEVGLGKLVSLQLYMRNVQTKTCTERRSFEGDCTIT